MNVNVFPSPPRQRRVRRLLTVVPVLLIMTPLPSPAGAETKTDAAADASCEWRCLRWGRQCNVDPRGVRRCRRSCEKFAEVCPPDADEPAPAEPAASPSP